MGDISIISELNEQNSQLNSAQSSEEEPEGEPTTRAMRNALCKACLSDDLVKVGGFTRPLTVARVHSPQSSVWRVPPGVTSVLCDHHCSHVTAPGNTLDGSSLAAAIQNESFYSFDAAAVNAESKLIAGLLCLFGMIIMWPYFIRTFQLFQNIFCTPSIILMTYSCVSGLRWII